ncbi:MAG: DUF493 domain-containing protein [Burkholderiales bacterium]|jgi:putative lipoic acid-binding regulatory protein|nr:DUF493 domain-containing protein [Burkholderiales bacterium]
MTEPLLTFPVDFPIKIVGVNEQGFAQAIVDIVRAHCPDYNPAEMTMRPSKENRYLSLTLTPRLDSREQLDLLYRALHAHPLARFVL